MVEPIANYSRVPPPLDPASANAHLDGEFNKLERTTASIASAIAALPATYATVVDLTAETSTRTAADLLKASITYVDAQDAAEAAARTAADALKATIVYVDAQDAAEAAARTAADALKAPLASPTFTGTPAAPTPTAGDSTTKLATTAFVGAAISATVAVAGSDKVVVTSTTRTDFTGLTFPVKANMKYPFSLAISLDNMAAGGAFVEITAPSSPTAMWYGGEVQAGPSGSSNSMNIGHATAAGTALSAPAMGGWTNGIITIRGCLINGATAGNVQVRVAQLNASGTTTFRKGSYIEYREVP